MESPPHKKSSKRFAAFLIVALLAAGSAAAAQSYETPPPAPVPAPAAPLPPAGVVPATLSLDVTGSPAADPAFLDLEIRKALNRQIRPTLRPGASIVYGPIVPWPLFPLAAGTRAAVNVTVTITGDADSAPVSGVTTIALTNVPVAAQPPAVLYLSDDPEYVNGEGVVFRGSVSAERPARLYYYHSDVGAPRDLDVVLTAATPSRVELTDSGAGPDLDVMSVGHAVTRDYLQQRLSGEGIVVDVVPGRPFVLRHALLLHGEVVAGTADVHVLAGGAVGISVVASPAGSRPEAYLGAPRLPYDGHRRHGTFDLRGYGAIAETYTAGGPPASAQYGGRATTPRNLDPSDDGRDYGDYGVVHRITFTLVNPTDAAQLVYLYEKPLGGPVRSSFFVDGQLKELGCARLPQPYRIASYQLPAQTTGATTTITMTDGGSFYPLEFGVTDAPPQPTTPPVGHPDGCSSNPPPFVEPPENE